jgi:hypothetical protein
VLFEMTDKNDCRLNRGIRSSHANMRDEAMPNRLPGSFRFILADVPEREFRLTTSVGCTRRSEEGQRVYAQLAEFLVAGQRPVCFTCYAHHFPPRMKKGAPIQSLLSEGVGEVGGAVSVLKGAPHPNAALLWARWAISEEGQRVYAQAGETPAHPNVEPVEKVRPAAAYMLTIDDIKEFPRYEKLWKEIFQLR